MKGEVLGAFQEGRYAEILSIAEEVGPLQPTDVEIHRDGRLFVTDAMNRVLYVFKVM